MAGVTITPLLPEYITGRQRAFGKCHGPQQQAVPRRRQLPELQRSCGLSSLGEVLAASAAAKTCAAGGV